jgi:predicted transcriptional regulator
MKASMELIKLLNTDARQGPPTQFQPWHLLAAFYAFCQSTSPIGRYQLGSDLGLGGGSIRSLIRFLRDRGLIEPVKRQGHRLSLEGNRQCEKLNQTLIKLVELPESSYTVDAFNSGCHLRRMAHHITNGVEQRDAAIQAGATGATTLIQTPEHNRLIMPTSYEINKQDVYPLIEAFDLREGDIIIIGSGSTPISAQLGAFAAAITVFVKEAR